MASCIGVYPQEKIVLHRLHLDHTIQIPSLETTIKDKLIAKIQGGVHALKSPVEYRRPIIMIIL